MRTRPLAIVLLIIALAVPRLVSVHAHVIRKAGVLSSSVAGRHRRPPPWHKRPCAGRPGQSCGTMTYLDSSGLCMMCAPSPYHPGHLVMLHLESTRAIPVSYTAAGLPIRKPRR